MIVVGLTGTISSGKSTLLRMFKELGADVLSSDEIVKHAMKKGTKQYERIVNKLGSEVIERSGNISKAKLKCLIRRDPKVLVFLEKVLHPHVKRVIRDTERRLNKTSQILIVEVPLLFETRMQDLFDKTIAVKVPSQRIFSFSKWNDVKREDLKFFLKRQWPQAKKAKYADYVISNNDTMSCLRTRAKEVFFRLLNKDKSKKKGR